MCSWGVLSVLPPVVNGVKELHSEGVNKAPYKVLFLGGGTWPRGVG